MTAYLFYLFAVATMLTPVAQTFSMMISPILTSSGAVARLISAITSKISSLGIVLEVFTGTTPPLWHLTVLVTVLFGFVHSSFA